MRNYTPFVDLRLDINTTYDEFCQCNIVSVNLGYGKQVWML